MPQEVILPIEAFISIIAKTKVNKFNDGHENNLEAIETISKLMEGAPCIPCIKNEHIIFVQISLRENEIDLLQVMDWRIH